MAFQIPVINALIQHYVQQNSHKLHVSSQSKPALALIEFSWQKDVPVKCGTSKKLRLSAERVLCHHTDAGLCCVKHSDNPYPLALNLR